VQTHPDPHTPPPRHKDKSGVVVRVAILTALLGVSAVGVTYFVNQPIAPLVAEEAEPVEQVASLDPALTPVAPSANTLGDSAPPPAPAQRAAPAQRSAPTSQPSPAPVQQPVEPPPESLAPTPIAPAPAPLPDLPQGSP